MRYVYSDEDDTLYIRLSEEPISDTKELTPACLVDLDRFGHAVGIEFVHLSVTWPCEELRELGLDNALFHDIETIVQQLGSRVHLAIA